MNAILHTFLYGAEHAYIIYDERKSLRSNKQIRASPFRVRFRETLENRELAEKFREVGTLFALSKKESNNIIISLVLFS